MTAGKTVACLVVQWVQVEVDPMAAMSAVMRVACLVDWMDAQMAGLTAARPAVH